jgi:hypothetical protein
VMARLRLSWNAGVDSGDRDQEGRLTLPHPHGRIVASSCKDRTFRVPCDPLGGASADRVDQIGYRS